MSQYRCTVCGYTYDEAVGIPSAGIAPGTKWSDLPDDWKCPLCGAAKADFVLVEEEAEPAAQTEEVSAIEDDEYRELTAGELSALCSNLAHGCEKQYLKREADLFLQLADYFKARAPKEQEDNAAEVLALVQKDLNDTYPQAFATAKSDADRGALRALTWGDKITRMLNSILTRYQNEGDSILKNTSVWVCTVCGFVYIGDQPPEKCPVCSVPAWKFQKVIA